MSLNIPTRSSESVQRIPIVKYDGRAGRAARVDRREVNGSWESENVDITNNFQAVFDMENIETGWLHFPMGSAPDIRTVKDGLPLPERPSDNHRHGYRLLMLLGKTCGGDVREMASSAKVAITAMDILDDQWKAGRKEHPGMLPVVKLAGSKAVVTSGKPQGQPMSSTNYQPLWQIVKWLPRPPELSPEAIAALTGRTVERQVSAPAALPLAPQQAAAVDDDF